MQKQGAWQIVNTCNIAVSLEHGPRVGCPGRLAARCREAVESQHSIRFLPLQRFADTISSLAGPSEEIEVHKHYTGLGLGTLQVSVKDF